MKRLFLLFGIYAALALGVNAQKAPGPVARYQFDHTGADTVAVDGSGNKLDLSLSDDTGWSTDGVLKGSLDIGGHITASTDDDTLFQVQAFTIALYARIDPDDKNPANYLVSQGDNYGLWIRNDGAIRFYLHYLAPDQSSGWVGVYATNVNAKDGYWHHIAATFDTTDLVATVYMDGDMVVRDTVRNSGSGLAPPPHSQIWFKWDGFSIGSNGGKQFTHGSVDEAVFYNVRLDGNTIKAMVADRYPLSTVVEGDGTVTPASGTSFYHSDTIQLMAHPAPGGIFKGWTIADSTGVYEENPITIPVTDHGVKATASFGTTLVAQYKFDHEGDDTIAVDATPNDLDLDVNKGDAWNTAGVVKGCLDLDGSTVASTDDDTLFQIQAFTFASYVRVAPDISGANYIMSQGDNYGLWIRDSDGAIRFYIHYQNVAENSDGWVGIYATDVDMRDGLWHHVAVTFDTTDLVASIYVDGMNVASDTVRNSGSGLVAPPHSEIWYKWDGFSLGANGTSQYTHGSIDEAVYYARRLSADEIKALVVPRYTLTTQAGDGGSVVPAAGKYYLNDTVLVTAVPDIGSTFKGWKLDDGTTSMDNPIKLTISKDVSLTAEFSSTLVAQYKLDHSGADTIAVDASGNGIDLELSGADGWSDAGVVGGCLNTGGSIQGMTEDDTLFQVQSLSFASYVRIDPSNTKANYIMTQGDNYGLWVREDGVLRFYIHAVHFGSDTVDTWVGTNAEGTNLKDGYWHHVAVTFDTTDLVATLYIDGDTAACDTVRNSGSGLAPMPHSQIWFKWDNFYLGSGGGSKYVDGSIDEAVFYATRLSGDDIEKMLAQRYPLTTSVTGNGSVVPADGMFYMNDTLMLTAVADEGWVFDKWDESGTVTGTDNPVTITVTDAVNAIAVFSEGTGIRKVNALEGVSVYPNPFTHGITVAYDLEDASDVNISVYNTVGKLVSVLVDTRQAGGSKTVVWNGADANGNNVDTGLYFIRLQMDGKVAVMKVIKR